MATRPIASTWVNDSLPLENAAAVAPALVCLDLAHQRHYLGGGRVEPGDGLSELPLAPPRGVPRGREGLVFFPVRA